MIVRYQSPHLTLKVILLSICLFISTQPVWAKESLILALPEFPPYQYIEDGQKKGFKLDLLREASQRAGYDLKIEFRPWARSLRMIETGQADFTNMYKNAEREKLFTFSKDPIFPITIKFFKPAHSRIDYNGNFENLADLKIGVVNKFSYGQKLDDALRSGLFKHIQQVNHHENLVSLLMRNRVDIIVGASYVIDSVISKNNLGGQILPVTPAISDADVYNAFTKTRDMKKAADKLDAALQSMRDDGSFNEIIYRAFTPETN